MTEEISSKAELLDAIRKEWKALSDKMSSLSQEELVFPGAMGDWSVKDILSHLTAWEKLLLEWYEASRRGGRPQVPGPGLTWAELDLLNRQLYEQDRERPLDEVLQAFRDSYRRTLSAIEAMDEEDLLTAGRFPWTGRHSLVVFASHCTSGHYAWAREEIHPERIRKGLEEKG